MTLILAATPLGNPGDASTRLKSAIESASIIAAEDSRRFHRLCADIGVTFTARVLSFFEGNEEERSQELLAELKSGATVLVVSDAGMPTISDPGFRLMRDTIAQGVEVSVIPGPSAVTMAVALSGLPTDRFSFEGFPPRTAGARLATFEKLRFEERTMVFFEAPHRLVDSLADCVREFEAAGMDRKGAIATVADEFGIAKRLVYAAVVDANKMSQ
jgi:16S rRNA (cytidine1402-2'-O)-methyltransferase